MNAPSAIRHYSALPLGLSALPKSKHPPKETPMIRTLALAVAAAGALTLFANGAQAQCAPSSVTGIGRPSAAGPIARFSARTAWRRAVIARRGLGARYAVISRAKRSSHSCRAVGNRTLCRYSATPCRL
jgi:hypothetical protein